MLDAVIFDMDGIVVNTVPIHYKAWKKMFNEYGKKFNFEIYKQKVDGIPRMDGARSVLTDISEEELKEAASKKQDYFLEFLNESEIPVYKRTLNLIKNLKKNDVPRAVISSSKNCVPILKKTGIYKLLNTVVDGKKITKGKPDPQIFLMAADDIKRDPKNCVVFEDAVLGVESAKNAGMFCIGIDRYDQPDRLKKADIVRKEIPSLKWLKKNIDFSF